MRATLPLLAVLTACGDADVCDLGTIRDADGTCVDYAPGDPVEAEVPAFPAGITWQWQLTGPLDTTHDVEVYDLDLFDLDETTVDALHREGRLVLCYLSAGSFEPWRPDADTFPDEVVGRPLAGWPDERWLDITDARVRTILEARLDLAAEIGCDGVEPDNVTGWAHRTGFGLNATEQLEFNRFLADAAHARGLAIALKNDLEQIPELLDWFDLAVNESCAVYDECGTLAPFVDADRAVLHAEYVDAWGRAEARAEAVCGVAPGLSTLVKTWDLGPERIACP